MYIAECVSGIARAYTAVLECPTLATVGQSILEVLVPIIARRESETNACLDGVGTEDGLLHPQSAATTRTGYRAAAQMVLGQRGARHSRCQLGAKKS